MKIEYPETHGKAVYECLTHVKLFGSPAFMRREKLYKVSVVEVIEIAPGIRHVQVTEDALVCAECYQAMGYKSKWTRKAKDAQEPTPDMFKAALCRPI